MKTKVKRFVKFWLLELLDILSLLLFIYAIIGIVYIVQFNVMLFYMGLFLLIYTFIRLITINKSERKI
jgi:hypothetical protein